MPRSRKEALDIRALSYFTGKPCVHGHLSERFASSGQCKGCIKEKWALGESAREAKKENRFYDGPPCVRCGGTQRYTSGDGCAACLRQRSANRFRALPKELQQIKNRLSRSYRARKRAGLVTGRVRLDKMELLAAKAKRTEGRPAVCEACGERPAKAHDHCHKAGHWRGWLCTRCNLALGLAEDSPERLERLAEYLRHRMHPWSEHAEAVVG